MTVELRDFVCVGRGRVVYLGRCDLARLNYIDDEGICVLNAAVRNISVVGTLYFVSCVFVALAGTAYAHSGGWQCRGLRGDELRALLD